MNSIASQPLLAPLDEKQTHDLGKVERQHQRDHWAVKAGIRAPAMAAELDRLETRKLLLTHELEQAVGDSLRTSLHPALAQIYRVRWPACQGLSMQREAVRRRSKSFAA